MKILPFMLVVALVGCGRSDDPGVPQTTSYMERQIQEWIPAGTPLAVAMQIMEQHHFACRVASYDSKAAMPPGSGTIRWDTGIIRSGKAAAVTNLSLLTCSRSIPNGGASVYEVILTVLNGETDRALTISECYIIK
jgi:hypothetical protein